jgi:hypothetical protein
LQLRTESAHEEGGLRDWAIGTTKFTGDEHGNVKELHAIRVGPPPKFEPMPGTEFIIDADLVLLALGFLGPVKPGMIEQLGVNLDSRSNVATESQLHELRCRGHAPRPVFAAARATCAAASRWWCGLHISEGPAHRHMVMIIPKNAHVGKTQRIRQKDRNAGPQGREIGARGHLQLQHHDGEDDGKHAIGESFQTLLTHRRPLNSRRELACPPQPA